MEFNWTARTIKEWRQFLAQTKNANWMQSWSYAQAAFIVDHLLTKIALIEKDKIPIGMMCVQEIKFGPIHIVNLKRGPLWFVEPTQNLIIEFAEAFRKQFPKGLFKRMRWMPEIEMHPQSITKLEKIGFKLRNENFTTSLIDLQPTLHTIKAGLQQKWRNCLNKSERSFLEVQLDLTNRQLENFLHHYQQHVKFKNFLGPSLRFLRTEFANSEKTQDHFFLWAFKDQKPVAGIAITRHGTTAAYRIGWNTNLGRKHNAHYALLWKAIEVAKQLGHTYLDLGGLLPDSAAGVTHFKKGLNGQEITLATFGN